MKKNLAPETDVRLEKLRALIDKIDSKIVKLLNIRASTAIKLGKLKKQLGCSVRAKQREREVLVHVRKCNHGPLPDKLLLAIYMMIIAGCRDVQQKKKR